MDILSKRISRAVESILENEGLVSGLDEAAAEVLQQWGIKTAARIAEDTEMFDAESAERAMYPQMRALRRLIRSIRVWLQYEQAAAPQERARLWSKVESQVHKLYGRGMALPPADYFSGQAPVEFVKNLRDWLESNKRK